MLALWLAWPHSLSKEEYPMIKWLLRRRMDAFEKEYDYDLSYAREILEVSARAAFKLGRVMGFGNYREDVPRDASFAGGTYWNPGRRLRAMHPTGRDHGRARGRGAGHDQGDPRG